MKNTTNMTPKFRSIVINNENYQGELLEAKNDNTVYLSSGSLSDTFFKGKSSSYLSQHFNADRRFQVKKEDCKGKERTTSCGFHDVRSLYDYAKDYNKGPFHDLKIFLEDEYGNILSPDVVSITYNGQTYTIPDVYPTQIDDPVLRELRWMTLYLDKLQENERLKEAGKDLEDMKVQIARLSECFGLSK